MTDFAKLKESVSIHQAAQFLGITAPEKNGSMRLQCPACKGTDRELAITPAKGVFFCFNAKAGGDLIALVAHVTGLSQKEAAEALDEHYGVSILPTPPQAEQAPAQLPTPPRRTGFDAQKFASRLAYTPEVEKLGISKENAERFGIGMCNHGSMRGFVVFPITNGAETHFIGWNGTEFKLPRWHSNVVSIKRSA
ncbi:MAG TPA: CHC2 zinc finger domain-containing protein [Xanthobacteraceae bacterium]